MSVLEGYRNLNRDELQLADHYAESGNSAGLQHMQRLSASREKSGERSSVIDRRGQDRLADWRAEAGI